MLGKVKRAIWQARSYQSIAVSLARGNAGANTRQVDLTDTRSWEFSGFSQNGEDGIIDVLSHRMITKNRYFVEIGASDGLENNTTWLALVRRYSGLWIEGSEKAAEWSEHLFRRLSYGLAFAPRFVTRENVQAVVGEIRYENPDVFSLDVDGNDFHLVVALMNAGLRPKVWVVEYNAAFGPELSVTIPYKRDFSVGSSGSAGLYYGCSIRAWRTLFARSGYRFLSVDQNGVNAFFIDPECFDREFLEGAHGLPYAENFSQFRQYGRWKEQFDAIAGRALEPVE